MDKPISVGDLVAIVRSCCIPFRDGVTIFRVESMRPDRAASVCKHCAKEFPRETYACDTSFPRGGAPLSWLKRIPPLSEIEGEKRDEEITA